MNKVVTVSLRGVFSGRGLEGSKVKRFKVVFPS